MNPPSATPFPPNARILVRGVNWLGDAVMSTPALLRLRAAYPGACITLLTPEKLSDLWLHHPAVDAAIPFRSSDKAFSIARQLRAGAFQAGLVLPNSFRSALELWLAKIPHRIGYAGQIRTWLLTRPVPPRPGAVFMHKRSAREVRDLVRSARPGSPTMPSSELCSPIGNGTAHHLFQYLHLVRYLGADPTPLAPQIVVLDEELHSFCGRHHLDGSSTQPVFGLNPGAEYGSAKRWPAERFIAAARQIQGLANCRWLIFGGKNDVALASQIASGIQEGGEARRTAGGAGGVINLAGATSLRELAAALKACRVLLTNDTGPMHLAAAVGTPVVALFGSTSPELTGPGLPGDPRHRLLRCAVPCAPCFQRDCPIDLRCLRGLTVSEVVQAVVGAK